MLWYVLDHHFVPVAMALRVGGVDVHRPKIVWALPFGANLARPLALAFAFTSCRALHQTRANPGRPSNKKRSLGLGIINTQDGLTLYYYL